MDLSVVVPIYNEVENVSLCYRELTPVLQGLGLEYEILFVDDGSRDGSTERLEQLVRCDARVKLVQLRRNFGQTAAMSAGMETACGDTIITIDGDLQNDPADIPMMLQKLQEGYDLVYGWRRCARTLS